MTDPTFGAGRGPGQATPGGRSRDTGDRGTGLRATASDAGDPPVAGDAALDQLFREAAGGEALPDALMARILGDAEHEIDLRAKPARPADPVAAPVRGRSAWSRRAAGLLTALRAGLGAGLGGGAALAGLAGAASAGVWLGAAQPQMLSGLGLTNLGLVAQGASVADTQAWDLGDLVPGASALQVED